MGISHHFRKAARGDVTEKMAKQLLDRERRAQAQRKPKADSEARPLGVMAGKATGCRERRPKWTADDKARGTKPSMLQNWGRKTV